MGADLYIQSIVRPAREKWEPIFDSSVEERNAARERNDDAAAAEAQKRVEEAYDKMYPDAGYFRDSYNGTSLFWALGLSWWQCPYVVDGEITPENAKLLLEQIRGLELKEINESYLTEHHCMVDDAGCSVRGWREYFETKKKTFEEFLVRAIELGETIEASC